MLAVSLALKERFWKGLKCQMICKTYRLTCLRELKCLQHKLHCLWKYFYLKNLENYSRADKDSSKQTTFPIGSKMGLMIPQLQCGPLQEDGLYTYCAPPESMGFLFTQAISSFWEREGKMAPTLLFSPSTSLLFLSSSLGLFRHLKIRSSSKYMVFGCITLGLQTEQSLDAINCH